MAYAISSNTVSDHRLVWAVILSILLHTLIVSTLHPFHFDTPNLAIPLQIELQQPKPEPPLPPPPEEVKPQPLPKQQPLPRPHPQPKEPLPEPPPVKMTVPTPAAPMAETPLPASPPEVIAVAPIVEQPPVFTAPAPPPESPKPAVPPQQDIDAAYGAYGRLLAGEFAKYRQYPRIAQMRGWQGTTRVKLEIDSAGNITSMAIGESSGHEVLDKQALEMVKKASPLPLPPEALRNRPFSILVPITFRLE